MADKKAHKYGFHRLVEPFLCVLIMNFPVSSNAFQKNKAGRYDQFVCKNAAVFFKQASLTIEKLL
jgi:hypothetical protein